MSSSSSYNNSTLSDKFTVDSNTCVYNKDHILSDYVYETTVVDGTVIRPHRINMKIKTETTVGKTGVMLVGLGTYVCVCVYIQSIYDSIYTRARFECS